MKEAKKMKCYERLIFKQFSKSQVFVAHSSWVFCRNVSRIFVELCVETPYWCTNIMAAENQQKHLEFTFPFKALSFLSKASIRAYKRIFQYLKWLYWWKSRGGTFFQRRSIPILVSHTVKTRRFKLLYFRNETFYGNGNLYKELLFVYLQPSVDKNS